MRQCNGRREVLRSAVSVAMEPAEPALAGGLHLEEGEHAEGEAGRGEEEGRGVAAGRAAAAEHCRGGLKISIFVVVIRRLGLLSLWIFDLMDMIYNAIGVGSSPVWVIQVITR